MVKLAEWVLILILKFGDMSQQFVQIGHAGKIPAEMKLKVSDTDSGFVENN